VQRHLARLAELAVDHGQQLGVEVDLAFVQPDGLTDSQAADGEQADQCLVGGGLQRRREHSGRVHQRLDLGRGVQVRRPLSVADRQQIGGRDLAGRIEGLEMPGEATHHRQPTLPPDRIRSGRLCRPRHRRLGGDGVGPDVVQIADELQQQLALSVELVAQGPAHRQVLLGGLAKWARTHRAPPAGHGRASSRSAS